MKWRLSLFVVPAAACAALAGGASGSPPVALGPPATADGLAIQVVGTDQALLAATSEATAPPDADVPDAAFAYPDDGSVISADSTSANGSASGSDGTASMTTKVSKLSLFLGEITADQVTASVSSAGTVGDLSDSTLENLMVFGAPVVVGPNVRIALADWGHAVLLAQTTKKGDAGTLSWRGTVTALVVHLDADHGGLPAGSEIRIGYADAYARPPEAASTTTTAAGTTTSGGGAIAPPRIHRVVPQMPAPGFVPGAAAGVKTAGKKPKTKGGPLVLTPPTVTPKLTSGGYVFPVYGPSGYSDTFGAARADVSGGWHHGDDIFAPLGAPILAVANGTVFSVGWNEVGGWRLWLRDQGGNEFYYAHLSAYTSLAVNGRHVKAGQVLGFVGNTGDAQGTPFHLHFEVHPVSMLFLGYDGAVDPTKYLDAWKRLDDVRILPAVPVYTTAAQNSSAASSAPAPGAILLESSDISTASGLDPGSLRRAMRGPAPAQAGGSSPGDLPTPLPILDRA